MMSSLRQHQNSYKLVIYLQIVFIIKYSSTYSREKFAMTSYHAQQPYPQGQNQYPYPPTTVQQNPSLYPQFAQKQNPIGYVPPHQYQTMDIQANEQNKLLSEERIISEKIKTLDSNLQGSGFYCYTMLLYFGILAAAVGTLFIMLQGDSILNAIFVPICCFVILTFILLLLSIRGKCLSKANIAVTLLCIQIAGLIIIGVTSYLQTVNISCSGFDCLGQFIVMLFSAGGLLVSLIYLFGALKVRRILAEREELEKGMEAAKFDQEYL